MTREEIADKLEELAKGIREGKTLEENVYGNWKVMPEERLNAFNVNSFRVKPEPQYIPFTADDWREFKGARVQRKDFNHFATISYWNEQVFTIPGEVGVCYDRALSDYIFADTGKPFGKQVQS